MRKLRILSVEDSDLDSKLIRKSLQDYFCLSHFERVRDANALRDRLSDGNWDLVLSGYNLSDFSPQEALAFVRERSEYLPFILVSESIGEEKAVEILKFGADDIVLKSNLNRLPLAVERVMRELRIRESEAQARRTAERAVGAREQMLTIVSHDLRNPLGAIQLNAETIREKIANARSIEEARQTVAHVESIVRASLRMKNLIADVLDRARLEGGAFALHPCRRPLNEFLCEIWDTFSFLAREKGLQFTLHEPARAIEVCLDFERLAQILSNLIGNAIKFSPSGGRVEMSVRVQRSALEFRVRDTGPGIASEDLERVFDKFWQNPSASRGLGLGLGLTIARDLVAAHGGRIWVESEKGQGSDFVFFLPCEWREVPPSASDQDGDSNRWICLVDDDDDLREILHESLRMMGYRVSSYVNGRSVLEDLQGTEKFPDLMILDYRLPDMNGGEVMDLMRPSLECNKVPVIFLSAEANLSHLASRHQATTFLTKPLRLRDLSKAIEGLMR